jgi:hypothetical protein
MNEALQDLAHVDGKRFCIVRMDVVDEATNRVSLVPANGIARIMPDRLIVQKPSGDQLVIPDSALPSILPSDGNAMLGDAEYYVIVKVATM